MTVIKKQRVAKIPLIKSVKQISEIKRGDLFTRDGLKRGIDKKFAVSLARKISTGFENINLQKEPTKNQYKKARKVVEEYFNAAMEGKSRNVRPSKKNRKIYAEYADLPQNFKIFPVQISSEKDKFIIVKEKSGKKKIAKRGDHVTYTDYLYPSRLKAMKNPEKETAKLLKRIEDNHGKNVKTVFVKVGKHQTRVDIQKEIVHKVIDKWTMQYGIERTKKFVMGLRTATFHNQQVQRKSTLKLKKQKHAKKGKR